MYCLMQLVKIVQTSSRFTKGLVLPGSQLWTYVLYLSHPRVLPTTIIIDTEGGLGLARLGLQLHLAIRNLAMRCFMCEKRTRWYLASRKKRKFYLRGEGGEGAGKLKLTVPAFCTFYFIFFCFGILFVCFALRVW